MTPLVRWLKTLIVLTTLWFASPAVVRTEELQASAPPQGEACEASWEWTLALANGGVVTKRFNVPAPLAAHLKDATADDLITWFRTLPTQWKDGDPLPLAPANVPQAAMDDFVVQFLDYLEMINREVPKEIQDRPGRFAWRDGCGRLMVVLPPGTEAPVPGTPEKATEPAVSPVPTTATSASGSPKKDLPLILSIAGFASTAVAGGLALFKDGELKRARDALAAIPPGPMARDEFDAQFDSARRVQRERDIWRTAAIGLGAFAGATTFVAILRAHRHTTAPQDHRKADWTVRADPAGRTLILEWRF